MREVWLQGNRRAMAVSLVVPALCMVLGGGIWVGAAGAAARWAASVLLGLGAVLGVSLVVLWRTPRLAYSRGELLVYLRSSMPYRVPIEAVECFLFAEGPSGLARGGKEPTRAVLVRLAEGARELRDRQVHPALGQWRESHILIRGTWCEPIDGSLLKRLNDRLIAVKRERSMPRGSAPR
ncbi:MAG: hypothetical protein FJ297_10205 [Planctomycetes bacterium]|nr:hypothetical protein [Planctomycetota bacterium]